MVAIVLSMFCLILTIKYTPAPDTRLPCFHFGAFFFICLIFWEHEEQMLSTIFRDTMQRVIKSQPGLLVFMFNSSGSSAWTSLGFSHSCPTQPLRIQPSPRSQRLRNVVYTKIVVHIPFPLITGSFHNFETDRYVRGIGVLCPSLEFWDAERTAQSHSAT